jgi:hypothetical protein
MTNFKARAAWRGVALLAAALLLACHGDASGGTTGNPPSGTSGPRASGPLGSCDKSALGVCYDYTGSQYTVASVQAGCTALSAAYSAQPCSTANRAGSCTIYKGLPSEQVVRYYKNKFTDSKASLLCTALNASNPPSAFTND